jgi:hypothetical protein
MDPARRVLMQVSVDDAVIADETFIILMGDEVEPRRRFIEETRRKSKNWIYKTARPFEHLRCRALRRSKRALLYPCPNVVSEVRTNAAHVVGDYLIEFGECLLVRLWQQVAI